MDQVQDHQYFLLLSLPCWLGKPTSSCPSWRVNSLDSQAWTPQHHHWDQTGVFRRSMSWQGYLSGRKEAAQINLLELNGQVTEGTNIALQKVCAQVLPHFYPHCTWLAFLTHMRAFLVVKHIVLSFQSIFLIKRKGPGGDSRLKTYFPLHARINWTILVCVF